MMNTPKIIKRTSGIIFILICTIQMHAQRINWYDRVDETFVFEITDKEALTLLKSNSYNGLVLKMLHSPRGSFSGKWINKPEQGHFIFANIHKNRINYYYHPVIPFQVFLFKEYGVFTIQVVDQNGNIRKDAKVKINKKRVYYDHHSQTYTLNDESTEEYRILMVELNNFQAIFDLQKHFVYPQWDDWDREDNRPDFYSYLITDKNKYKPGEKVRFKSYALNGNRRPIKKELEIWFPYQNYNNKKIGTLLPHHPGGFAGEVHIHDSLGLTLDRNYTLQLREPNGKIVASTNFKYEDYELYGNKLEIKLDTRNHYYPQRNKLEIKAVDANGLFLPDMKADVTIRRSHVLKSYSDLLILPDTLFHQRIDLNDNVPTVVSIPPELFGESDCQYHINVLTFSVDNQRMEQSENATFYRSKYDVMQTTQNDKIRFAFFELGQEKTAEAELSYNDGTDKKRITLPYEEKFNQTLSCYNIQIIDPSFHKSFNTNWVNNGLKLTGGIEKGVFDLELSNPLQLDFSWYVYEGNVLIQKGAGKTFDFKTHKLVDETKTYYAEIFYYIGGEEEVLRRTYTAKPEHLTVNLDMPERIYPGQTVNSTIRVTDYKGSPVRGVDLTAFAVNTQLNYYIPDLPYYGDSPETREQRSSYSMHKKTYAYNTTLDYLYWKDRVGLDKIPYYQFTYPWNRLFTHTVHTPDSITQFAPFVMNNGETEQIYVIEVNDQPVYFSWTEQPQAYSFPVSDNRKHKIALRLHDRALILDSIHFEPGKKTILSVDLAHLPPEVKTVWLSGNFTQNEINRYRKLIARFPAPKSTDDYAYYQLDSTYYLIYQSCFTPRNKSILAGPVPEGYGSYNRNVLYRHEGGYAYQYEQNVVYKLTEYDIIPRSLSSQPATYTNRLNDFYLSPKVLEEKINNCKRSDFIWHPSAITISQQNIHFTINLPIEKDSSGVSNLLFQQVDSGKIIYPDQLEYGRRKFATLPNGQYNIILLYNNGKYIKQDSVTIQPNTYIQLNMNTSGLHEKDSVSEKWLRLGVHAAEIAERRFTNRPEDNHTIRTFRNASSNYNTGNVSGYVYDEQGEPIIGASVHIKGTSIGAVTDLDGYFSIQMSEASDILVISFIGYQTQEIKITTQTQLSIILKEDTQTLDEVVVVGYGTYRRSEITGAVATVREDHKSSPPAEEIEEVEDDYNEDETKNAEEKLYNELLQLSGLRKNFSDVGFWEPRLYTDRKGKAEFTVTFPDNITRWETVVYAMNRKLKTGTTRKSIRSFKPLMGELKLPQFLTVGDSSFFVGSVRNYTNDPVILGEVTYTLQQDTLMHKKINLGSSHTDKLLVEVKQETDSITAQYIFTRDDGYIDGEERSIPVIQQGTNIAQGTLKFLTKEETDIICPLADEEVHLTITGNQLDVYMDATYYLIGYEYACNEQLASKLIGLLNYKLYTTYIGEAFTYDKNINEIIERLLRNQNKTGLWSWWGHADQTSHWMSSHIFNALNMAAKAGYNVTLDLERIKQNLPVNNNYTYLIPYRGIYLHDIETLHSLSMRFSNENYAIAVDTLQKLVRQYEITEDSLAHKNKYYQPRSYLKEKMMLWEIQQRQGLSNIIDSIRPYLKKNVLGAVYCDDGKQARYWYTNNLTTTLIAYRMISNDSSLMHLKEPMQMYLLSTKEHNWNTYQAASVTSTILPDLVAAGATKQSFAKLELNGSKNKTLTTFPYDTIIKAGESLALKKVEGAPLIMSTYTIRRVKKANNGEAFEITTALNQPHFTAGEPAQMTVNVKVKQEGAEHVMIEIPIPAGCSYASKHMYNSYYGHETHREYFKEKTVIFCEKLPIGDYKFHIELLPRYTGSYILNPAKVEMMYLPVVNANNDLKKVSIVERK